MKTKFAIGDWVEVKGITCFEYTEAGQRLAVTEFLVEPKLGQIVGGTYRQEGQYIASNGGAYNRYGDYDDYDPPRLEVENARFVYQIRTTFTGKPIEAFEEDICLAILLPSKLFPPRGWAKEPRLPFRAGEKWPEEAKQNMKAHPEIYPRDSKGRFVKMKPVDINNIQYNAGYSYAAGYPE